MEEEKNNAWISSVFGNGGAVSSLFTGLGNAISGGIQSQNQLWAVTRTNDANLQLSKDQLLAKQLEIINQRQAREKQLNVALIVAGVVVLIALLAAGVAMRRGRLKTS